MYFQLFLIYAAFCCQLLPPFFSADSILGESFSSFAKGNIDVVLSLLQLINTN